MKSIQHTDWQMSTNKMTFWCRTSNTDGNKIIDAAPIARRFIGQPLDNLKRWLSAQDGFIYEKLFDNKEEL